MCAVRFRRDSDPDTRPAVMRLDTFRRIMDQFPGLDRLHLQGLGEPLLNPSFFDMAAYAAGKGLSVSASSNLTVLDERMAEACITSGLDCLHVSVDAAEAATYEAIRPGSSFPVLLDKIDLLVREKGRAGATRPSLRMTTVVMRRNLRQLPDLVLLAAKFRMEQVFVQHLCHSFQESTLPAQYGPMKEFVEKESLTKERPERVEECFCRARETAERVGIDLRLPSVEAITNERPSHKVRCDWPWTGMYVSYQGYVMPCCMVSTPDRINFGNVANQPLAEIWNGPVYEAFRERLSSDHPPEICAACSVYSGTF